METEIVLISSTGAIEGGRVLYTIGKIEVASSWHPEGGAPLQDNWQETILRDLIWPRRKIDADAIIGLDYQNDAPLRSEETGVKMKRIVATGIAVKLYLRGLKLLYACIGFAGELRTTESGARITAALRHPGSTCQWRRPPRQIVRG